MNYKENIAVSFYKVRKDIENLRKDLDKIKDNQTQILIFLNKLKVN